MNLLELTSLVSAGEGQTVEFKNRTPDGDKLAREAVSFANAIGGWILIGVDDDGTVRGVKDSIEEEYAVNTALNAHCEPPVDWSCEKIRISKKRDVLVLRVKRSRTKPHAVVSDFSTGVEHVYVRVDDKALEASEESIALMKTENDLSDVTFEMGYREERLFRYLEEYGSVTVRSLSQQLGESESIARAILVTLTRAGLLRFSNAIGDDRFFRIQSSS